MTNSPAGDTSSRRMYMNTAQSYLTFSSHNLFDACAHLHTTFPTRLHLLSQSSVSVTKVTRDWSCVTCWFKDLIFPSVLFKIHSSYLYTKTESLIHITKYNWHKCKHTTNIYSPSTACLVKQNKAINQISTAIILCCSLMMTSLIAAGGLPLVQLPHKGSRWLPRCYFDQTSMNLKHSFE